MKFLSKTIVLTGVFALVAVPAWALPSQAPTNSGTDHAPASAPSGSGNSGTPRNPGPSASLPAKAKAYGNSCQNQSKKHIAGQKGTPFSQCVTAMARLATGTTDSPRVACRGESKKHVKGQKGTPFSRCVSAGAKLLRQQHSEDSSDEPSGDS
jgi:hypothetical protein